VATRVETDKLEAWRLFLRSHSTITRRLDADLIAAHGLTLHDYEVLLHLDAAPDGTLRPSELTDRVLLTRSGVTRLLSGLEETGLVRRESCPSDRRVIYAVLTDEGRAKLREARPTHLRGVGELFVERFGDEQLDTLAELLSRLPGSETEAPLPPCD
jgi:DNA-binding MarR family transcriptional regulator